MVLGNSILKSPHALVQGVVVCVLWCVIVVFTAHPIMVAIVPLLPRLI